MRRSAAGIRSGRRRRGRRRAVVRDRAGTRARQIAWTAVGECETNRIVLPAVWNALTRRHALLLEVLVADREDLVEQQDVGIERCAAIAKPSRMCMPDE